VFSVSKEEGTLAEENESSAFLFDVVCSVLRQHHGGQLAMVHEPRMVGLEERDGLSQV
jgi:hypothetical protein